MTTAAGNYQTGNYAAKGYGLSDIFGPYIFNTRFVPGKEESADQKEKEKIRQLFEIVDDYIEQA